MGVAEELAGDDVRVALHEAQVFPVEPVLKPVQRLPIIVPLVNAGRHVTEYKNLPTDGASVILLVITLCDM